MGRRKKQYKKRQYKNGGNDASKVSNGDGSQDSLTFTNREKQRLRDYLADYQRIKIQQHANRHENKATITTADTLFEGHSETKIAGIVFPQLTNDEVLLRPLLALPSELAFRQRQYVHECCKERK